MAAQNVEFAVMAPIIKRVSVGRGRGGALSASARMVVGPKIACKLCEIPSPRGVHTLQFFGQGSPQKVAAAAAKALTDDAAAVATTAVAAPRPAFLAAGALPPLEDPWLIHS